MSELLVFVAIRVLPGKMWW